jgi:hypothetical protein
LLGGDTGGEREIEVGIERIRARMAAIESERAELEAALSGLVDQRVAMAQVNHQPNADALTVTTTFSSTDKVALFRRLFAGRPGMFPLRWENQKTAKSGYAPACANEWVRGICGKPRVKCGECPHQAFIPVTDSVIEKHLRGADSLRSSTSDFILAFTRCFLTRPVGADVGAHGGETENGISVARLHS